MLTLRFASETTRPESGGGRLVQTWSDDAGAEFARAFVSGTSRWIDWAGLGVFTFGGATRVVDVVPARGVSREVVTASFRRSIQPVILQAIGWQALHASAAGTRAGIIALCGCGHSGKSTLAHALGQAGYPQVADDAVVFSCQREGVIVQPLPFTPQLRPASRSYFEAQGALAFAPGDDAGYLAPEAPLRAVFVLTQDPSGSTRPTIRQLSAVDAFSALLTHAHCFDQRDGDHMRALVEAYMTVAQQVPVFTLGYRPNFAAIGGLVDAVIDAAIGFSPAALPLSAARRQ